MAKRTICVFILVLAGSSAESPGAGITFSNRAAFEAALSGVRRYNFETSNGFPSAPAAITSVDDNFLQFTSTVRAASLDLYGAGGNQALTGRINGQVDRSAPVTIITSEGMFAMGFDILDLGAQGVEGAFITVLDNTDRPVSPILVQDNDRNPVTPVFFGVIWDVPMTSVEVHGENLLCAGPGTCPTPNLIDNLTVVPAPGAALLVCIGAMMLGTRTRRASLFRAG